jgi:hypothetical protein
MILNQADTLTSKLLWVGLSFEAYGQHKAGDICGETQKPWG